ncbi:MAG: DUF1569 domain-containing protein [Spirochaetia bacterium]|nr:DUF1569 domain-containing protein [Spirochaetia bacterium]
MGKIRLKSLQEALQELEKLEKTEKVTALGEWSYSQILSHLRFFLEGSMKGFPESRSSFIRKSVGPNLLKNIKQIGYMPSGFRNSFLDLSQNFSDAPMELTNLKNSIREFINYSGNLSEHPIYGKLSREDWDLIHAYHIANHLGFLSYGKKIPKTKKISKKKSSSKKTSLQTKKKASSKKQPRIKKTAKKKSSAGKSSVKKSPKKSAKKKRVDQKKS